MRNRRHTAAVEGVRKWVGHNLGLQFEHDRTAMLKQRLTVVCRKHKLSLSDLGARLESGDRALAVAVAEEVSTNHTQFLREPEMFALLASTILPSLPAHGPLRIWSAACSSGEETYSIAMCAAATLGVAAQPRLRILGTDISDRQIRHAERGLFERLDVEDHAPRLMPYFVNVDPTHVQVRADIAALCVFRRLNLTQARWPFEHRFHVIFLRNVLYYFDVPMRLRVLHACFDAATPDAWLITSVTEPMLGAQSPWHPLSPGVFRKPAFAAPRSPTR